MFAKSMSYVGAFAVIWGSSMMTNAAIIINGTRVIYPGNEKVVTVQVKNEGDTPAMMQSWIDDGDADITPDKIEVPFVLTPPVSRVDANTGQSIQISLVHHQLPQDRESVFWLNILDIPAKPKLKEGDQVKDQSLLQIAIRSRIKLFYRPAQLAEKTVYAPNDLQWNKVGDEIEISNPTAYFVNISSLKTVNTAHSSIELTPEGLMIAPFQQQRISLKDHSVKSLEMESINDYGGMNQHKIDLK
ncbi:fimbria/pilus periplasmic chaperone [Acinetobacter rudis]|uniref:fimbrial biogenesis chaperone n=1 Tax=Acinetobacter rudis TaxID=632955 RepID=UPI002810099B|nr:fimbria/pilus periplasmic chaperone [Acinetobacter rudis]MDQ8952905.1 fimbria/pilus periplasmic chaperone [Acinetobacter rudis]